MRRLVMTTGSALLDQFQPWYFGVAFAFIFKYCTGMPDMPAFVEKARYRRSDDAPRIEIGLWVRVMARRVESQLSRDWHFGFATWNYMFRTSINMSRTLYTEQAASTSRSGELTAKDYEEGAICLLKALSGPYLDPNGKKRPVGGDMTKLRCVAKLSEAAKRLLRMVEHLTRKLPGTQEARRMMRFETHAYRVCYGVPIFVTFTPDEAHNTVMLRLSRARRGDPVVGEGGDPIARKLHGRFTPAIDTTPEDGVELTLDPPATSCPAIILRGKSCRTRPRLHGERRRVPRDREADVEALVRYSNVPALSRLQQCRQLHAMSRPLRKQQYM